MLIPWKIINAQQRYRWKFGYLKYLTESWYFKWLGPPFDSCVVGVITYTLNHEFRTGLVSDSSKEDNDEDRYRYWEDSQLYEDDNEDPSYPGGQGSVLNPVL